MRIFIPVIAVVVLSCGWCVAGETGTAIRESIEKRLTTRTFPSVFQAWSGADNLKSEPKLQTAARHDLIFHAPGFFGLQWDGESRGLATKIRPESIAPARRMRQTLRRLNPNVILIAEIRYRDASPRFLPETHPWWRREDGRRVPGWEEGRFIQLDFGNPEYRRHVAQRAKAVVETGVVDGVMLDWWRDDDDRLELVKTIRRAIGDDALILANANDNKTPRTAPYINGYFMECYRTKTAEDWRRIADTLSWAETHLRKPRINCLETWFHNSRQDLHLMRATTTLALTHSDGYCLFSDPNPLPVPDHRHDWYDFWNRGLGRPKGPGKKRDDGAHIREFDNGFAVYNPMGNREASIEFQEELTSRASGKRGRIHRVVSSDGDVFLRR